MADKRLFILASVQQHPIQDMQGQRFRMSQAHANTWIPLLHAALNQALADQNLLPARTADALPALLAKPKTDATSTSPLWGLMVLNGPSTVRKTLGNSKRMTVVRRKATRSKTSW